MKTSTSCKPAQDKQLVNAIRVMTNVIQVTDVISYIPILVPACPLKV